MFAFTFQHTFTFKTIYQYSSVLMRTKKKINKTWKSRIEWKLFANDIFLRDKLSIEFLLKKLVIWQKFNLIWTSLINCLYVKPWLGLSHISRIPFFSLTDGISFFKYNTSRMLLETAVFIYDSNLVLYFIHICIPLFFFCFSFFIFIHKICLQNYMSSFDEEIGKLTFCVFFIALLDVCFRWNCVLNLWAFGFCVEFIRLPGTKKETGVCIIWLFSISYKSAVHILCCLK